MTVQKLFSNQQNFLRHIGSNYQCFKNQTDWTATRPPFRSGLVLLLELASFWARLEPSELAVGPVNQLTLTVFDEPNGSKPNPFHFFFPPLPRSRHYTLPHSQQLSSLFLPNSSASPTLRVTCGRIPPSKSWPHPHPPMLQINNKVKTYI